MLKVRPEEATSNLRRRRRHDAVSEGRETPTGSRESAAVAHHTGPASLTVAPRRKVTRDSIPATLTDDEYRGFITDNYRLLLWLSNRSVAESPQLQAEDLAQETVLGLLSRPACRNSTLPFGLLLRETIMFYSYHMKRRPMYTGKLMPASNAEFLFPWSNEPDPQDEVERKLDRPAPQLPAEVTDAVRSLPARFRKEAELLVEGSADPSGGVADRKMKGAITEIRKTLGLTSRLPKGPNGCTPRYCTTRVYIMKNGRPWDQACCYIKRRRVLLGNPNSPESYAKYREVLTAAGFTPPAI